MAVTFPRKAPPAWPAVSGRFEQARPGVLQLRMIDGELVFPDEAVPEGWREVRVAAGGAMVTVRRQEDRVVLVVWGNADTAQLDLRAYLAWAWAAAGEGLVQTEAGPLGAAAFAQKLAEGG
jgi:hypothetical protein